MMAKEEFSTYEDEMARLEVISGFHTPVLTAGARVFLGGLSSWLSQGEDESLDRTAVVLPDPALNLSLPYPIDELTVAMATANKREVTETEVRELAGEFSLEADLLDRPTTALSGGERMMLSLCKSYAFRHEVEQMCLCSPYFWLDSTNRQLVGDKYSTEMRAKYNLLLLAGEEDTEASGETIAPTSSPRPLSWFLKVDTPTVEFPGQTFPRLTKPKVLRFHCDEKVLELRSPTLITGENGIGKTTLAKMLARMVVPADGQIKVVNNNLSGAARVMLQDTVVQLFGQSVNEHLERVFCFDKEFRKEARKIYDALQNDCMRRVASSLPGVCLGDGDVPRSILQCKLVVVVDRLFGRPPLLLLDEPGWCLSRSAARAFLQAVTETAHERQIAVAITSHQAGWWKDLIQDQITLIRGALPEDIEVRQTHRKFE